MTPAKVCFKCNEIKPMTEFYKHPMMGDGHLGKCKGCTRSDVIANRLARLGYYRAYDIGRSHTAKRMEFFRAKRKAKRAKMGRDYDHAHNALTRAVASGRLVRPTNCSRCCATGRIQGHHDDYTRALDVMWLCPACHAARHGELGRLGIRNTVAN